MGLPMLVGAGFCSFILSFNVRASRVTFRHNINYCVAGNWRRLSLRRMEQGGDKGQVEFHLEDFLKEEPVERSDLGSLIGCTLRNGKLCRTGAGGR